ncbi:hypothetical protein FRB91_008302 [Serendipita sp. 411]|nr:hypothetical protein FRC18_011222 [Serendipita sp. 400]KAG8851202.1 hypothetical protein FRB91_008302 [Serendipita sp. 411]
MNDRFHSVPILFVSNSTRLSVYQLFYPSLDSSAPPIRNRKVLLVLDFSFSLFINSHPPSHLQRESPLALALLTAYVLPFRRPSAPAYLPLFVLHPDYLIPEKMEFFTNVIEAVFGVPEVDDIPVDEDNSAIRNGNCVIA